MPQWHNFFSEFNQIRNCENVMRQCCQSLGIKLVNTICVNGFLSVSTLLLIECHFATSTIGNIPCIQNSPLLHWSRIKFIENFKGSVLKKVFSQGSNRDALINIGNDLMAIAEKMFSHTFFSSCDLYCYPITNSHTYIFIH